MVRLTFAKVANRWKGIFWESPVSREFDIRRATTMARIVQGVFSGHSQAHSLPGRQRRWARARRRPSRAAPIHLE